MKKAFQLDDSPREFDVCEVNVPPFRMLNDVKAFHKRLDMWQEESGVVGHLHMDTMVERQDFLEEEMGELETAVAHHNLSEQIDALLDIVYVALGTLDMIGADVPRHWAEIQRANMSKLRGVGSRGNKVDAIKPEGWQGPRHEEILFQSGYRENEWLEGESLIRTKHPKEDFTDDL